jgi:hypothetical protein
MIGDELRGEAVPIAGEAMVKRQTFEGMRTVETAMHEPDVRRFLEEHFA